MTCKNCRATVPLLKTRWLCKKANKRVLLTMEPNEEKTGIIFGIENDVPVKGGNAAQRREHDKRLGAGTMSRAGAKCPCCPTIMTMEDLRLCNRAREVAAVMTAVVVQGTREKEYRLPTPDEIQVAQELDQRFPEMFTGVPYGPITEQILRTGQGSSYGFPIVAHGITEWSRVFSPRQMATFAHLIRSIHDTKEALRGTSPSDDWTISTIAALCCAMSRLVDFQSMFVTWTPGGEFLGHTFVRYALPLVWDFAEGNPLVDASGSFVSSPW